MDEVSLHAVEAAVDALEKIVEAAGTDDRDEIVAMLEAARKLHRDAQGFPVAPGDSMWCPKYSDDDGVLIELVYRSGDRPVARRLPYSRTMTAMVGVESCYLHRAAAEAARSKE